MVWNPHSVCIIIAKHTGQNIEKSSYVDGQLSSMINTEVSPTCWPHLNGLP